MFFDIFLLPAKRKRGLQRNIVVHISFMSKARELLAIEIHLSCEYGETKIKL